MNPKILLIDDDPDMLTTYAEILEDHGFEVARALSRDEAFRALDNDGPWDVIVLDEKLRGHGGPATATQMLSEIAGRAPAARTIVLTGFATPQLVKTAMAAGAWDYLQKDAAYLDLLLPVRVRHAVEAARERRLRRVALPELERQLRACWTEALAPGLSAHKKGRLLEETLALLFRTIPGMEDVSLNRRSEVEELDVVVTNASADPVLSKEGSFILVECKNWSTPVGPSEMSHFRDKLRDRHGRVKLGILVGISGFTPGVEAKLQRSSNEQAMIVLLDGSALTAWIEASDRIAWLRERVRASALRETP